MIKWTNRCELCFFWVINWSNRFGKLIRPFIKWSNRWGKLMKSPGELMEKRKNTDQHVLQHGEIRCEYSYIYKVLHPHRLWNWNFCFPWHPQNWTWNRILRIFCCFIYIYMHVHACETTHMPLITVNVNCYQFKIGEENRANSI